MSPVLIGYRGSGKSTIGRKLADRLWIPFVDVDDMIVKRFGKTIREVFQEEGEKAFRDVESAVLAEACSVDNQVLAAGGGTFGRMENRALLDPARHRVVYLRCAPDVLASRIDADPQSAATRPNLTSTGGLEEIKTMLAQREPIYRQIMHVELDVTNLSPDEAVVRIAKLL